MSKAMQLVAIQTFADGKKISSQTISQPLKTLTKDLKLLNKELRKAVSGSPYVFTEIVQGDQKIRLTREEIRNLFVATHGPNSKFNAYTANPKNQPFPSRVIEGTAHINRLLETREQARERFAKEKKLYFTPTQMGSVMDENISRARQMIARQNK